jgi:plastocyanin
MAGRLLVFRDVIGVALAASLLGAACAKSPTASYGAQSPTSAATTSGSGGRYGGGGYGGGSGSSPSSSAGANTIQQGAGGYVFAPSMLTVKKGTTLTVTNVTSVPVTHTFTITGKGINVVNLPGQSQTLTINLAPGTYQFICTYHVSLGMKGTLVVTG